MIDWLTLVLDLPEHLWARCAKHAAMGRQIQCIDPLTGDIEWSTPARESVRSDSHQITVQVSAARVRISGSPARSMGLLHNVWGTDNLAECARAHDRVVCSRGVEPHLVFVLASFDSWWLASALVNFRAAGDAGPTLCRASQS